MDRVASRTIDDGIVCEILAVMDHHGPNINEAEKAEVNHLLQGENEGKHVIRQALNITIYRVECMRGERRGDNPLVMRLVEVFVDPRMVQATMCDINEGVGEKQKQRNLEQKVSPSAVVLQRPKQLRVALGFSDEPGNGEQSHDGNGLHGLINFHPDLILQIFRMFEVLVVVDHVVREQCGEKVQDPTENSGDEPQRDKLPDDVVTRKH